MLLFVRLVRHRLEDMVSQTPQSPRSASAAQISGLMLTRPVIAMTTNGRFIFTGGYLDTSLKCHVVVGDTVKPFSSVTRHSSPIVAMALSMCGPLLGGRFVI